MLFKLVLLLMAGAATVAAQTERKTVWTGAYTPAQAERGQAQYEQNCSGCHRGNEQLVNPDSRLKGNQFMQRWREDNVESLFSLIKATMPRRDPGSLSDDTYIDIISFLLKENGFPAGEQELAGGSLK